MRTRFTHTSILLFALAICLPGFLLAQKVTREVTRRGGNSPQLAIDSTGRFYFGEGKLLLRLTRSNGQVDTLFTSRNPIAGLVLSNLDSVLYFSTNDTIWKLATATGTIKRFYGNREYPTVLAIQRRTGTLFAIEVGGDNGRSANVVRYSANGTRTKIAGGRFNSGSENGYINAIGDTAKFQFYRPNGSKREEDAILFSANEDTLFLADSRNRCIRRLDLSSNRVTTFVGPLRDSIQYGYRNGYRQEVRFADAVGLALDMDGTILIADKGPFVDNNPQAGNRIRKAQENGQVTTVAGSGLGQGTGPFNNFDYIPGRHGLDALIGKLNALGTSRNGDTTYCILEQRIISLSRATNTLRFVPTPDRPVGSLRTALRVAGNISTKPISYSLLTAPANVSIRNGDSINVSVIAGEGLVVVQAIQELSDSVYATAVVDSFYIIPAVANRPSLVHNLATLAPNPFTTHLTLDVAPNNGPAQAIWTDVVGRRIATQTLVAGKNELAAPSPTPGLYHLMVTAGVKKQIFMVVKE